MKSWKVKIHIVAQELFQFSLVIYLVLLLLESLKQGFVSNYFNTTILLGMVLVSGVLMILTHTELVSPLHVENKKLTGADIQNSVLLAAGGAVLVFFKTQRLGTLAIIIACLTAALILLLSLLLFLDNDTE